VIRVALICAASLVVAVSVLTIIAYVMESESYHFGTEVGRWRYRTGLHYLLVGTSELVVGVSSLIVAMRSRAAYGFALSGLLLVGVVASAALA
jgi:hypothetical protein